MDRKEEKRMEKNMKRTVNFADMTDAEITHVIEELKNEGLDIDTDKLTSRKYIMDHILPFAMPAGSADEELFTIEDPAFLGIRFGFRMQGAEGGGWGADAKLNKTAPEQLDISLIELVQTAERNIHPVVTTTAELGILDFLGIQERSDTPATCVATTADRRLGAGVLLSPVLPEMIKDKLKTDRFYVLPTSVHEVMAVKEIPDDPDFAPFLLELVKDINASDVIGYDDYLSDNIYRYDGLRFSTIINTD